MRCIASLTLRIVKIRIQDAKYCFSTFWFWTIYSRRRDASRLYGGRQYFFYFLTNSIALFNTYFDYICGKRKTLCRPPVLRRN